MGLKRWFGQWFGGGGMAPRPERVRADSGPPPWRYPDPFTGKPIYPADDADRARLESAGLPLLTNLADLAAAMELPWQRVLWLASPSDRYSGGVAHYHVFTVPKTRGGPRLILAPKPSLKAAQHWILHNILESLPLGESAHGFRRGHSVVSHARAHCGREIVAQFDLEDYFHTVTYRRVRGLFRSLGYSTEVAVLLALLTTFRPEAYPHANRRHIPTLLWNHSMSTPRRSYRGFPTTPPFLPQGAPSSPIIANLVTRGLDRRLAGLARQFGASYTRYADDLTFSGDAPLRRDLGRFLPILKRVVREEGFFLAARKQRIHRKGTRQRVTGLVVNRHPNVPREDYRRLRVLIHRAATEGLAAVRIHPDTPADADAVRAHIDGWLAWLQAVNPGRAAPLVRRWHAVAGQPPPARS